MSRSLREGIEGLQRTLTALGQWDAYRALPQDLRERVREIRKPRLRFDRGWDGTRTEKDRAVLQGDPP
jgi:hypothetical protein